MSAFTIIISFITAFVLGAGSAFGVSLVALKGNAPDKITWIAIGVAGLVCAAKDNRALMKLPPVSTDPTKPTDTP